MTTTDATPVAFTDGQTAFETGLLANRAWTRRHGSWWRWFTNAIPGDPPSHDIQAPDHWITREIAHGRLRISTDHVQVHGLDAADLEGNAITGTVTITPVPDAERVEQIIQEAISRGDVGLVATAAVPYEGRSGYEKAAGISIEPRALAEFVAGSLARAATTSREPWVDISTDQERPTDAYVNGVPGRYWLHEHGVIMHGPGGDTVGWVCSREDVTSVEMLHTYDPEKTEPVDRDVAHDLRSHAKCLADPLLACPHNVDGLLAALADGAQP